MTIAGVGDGVGEAKAAGDAAGEGEAGEAGEGAGVGDGVWDADFVGSWASAVVAATRLRTLRTRARTMSPKGSTPGRKS